MLRSPSANNQHLRTPGPIRTTLLIPRFSFQSTWLRKKKQKTQAHRKEINSCQQKKLTNIRETWKLSIYGRLSLDATICRFPLSNWERCFSGKSPKLFVFSIVGIVWLCGAVLSVAESCPSPCNAQECILGYSMFSKHSSRCSKTWT